MPLAVDAVLDALEQFGVPARADLGVAELAHPCVFHPAAELRRHRLHAVADAQYRNAQLEDPIGRFRRGVLVYGGRAAREDDAARSEVADEGLADVEGMQLAIHLRLPDPARDQLRVLRAEVEDEDLVAHYSPW